VPVDFNEPLSALQRLTEELDYTHLLDEAADESNPHRRLALISIFALTSYSTSAQRTTKPFNPLLSETYECDRLHDRGFISVAEQVRIANVVGKCISLDISSPANQRIICSRSRVDSTTGNF
jgi:hypothetical protein